MEKSYFMIHCNTLYGKEVHRLRKWLLQGQLFSKMVCVDNTCDLAYQRDRTGCHDEESFEEVRLMGWGQVKEGRKTRSVG